MTTKEAVALSVGLGLCVSIPPMVLVLLLSYYAKRNYEMLKKIAAKVNA